MNLLLPKPKAGRGHGALPITHEEGELKTQQQWGSPSQGRL